MTIPSNHSVRQIIIVTAIVIASVITATPPLLAETKKVDKNTLTIDDQQILIDAKTVVNDTQIKTTTATDEEKQALSVISIIQSEAILSLNEALMTAQALRRANAYMACWLGSSSRDTEIVPLDIAALEDELVQLENRYLDVHRAHGLKVVIKYRKEAEPPISDIGRKMLIDSTFRTQERERFIDDCRAVRDKAKQLLVKYRSSLAELQKKAAKAKSLPKFETTPAFVNKPHPELLPDGTATGLLYSVTTMGKSNCGSYLLGGDYELTYDTYDRKYSVPPSELYASRDHKTQMVVPCAIHYSTYCDAKWYGEHKDEPIERAAANKPYGGQFLWPLDFRYQPVVDMMEKYITDCGRRYRDNKNILLYLIAWEAQGNEPYPGPWGDWATSGRTPAGIAAFHKYLKEKFGDIDILNKAWQSNYKDFDAIEPPTDIASGLNPDRAKLAGALFSGRSTPLYYEFHRFLKDSYADYLAFCYRTLKKADPNHPISISPSYGEIDGNLSTARDSFRWAENACDIYGSEMQGSIEEVFGWSIHRLLGRTIGNSELIWNGYENWTNPPESVSRAAGRRNLWRAVAWGRKILGLYGAFDTYGGASHNNMMVYETDCNLMRLSGGVVGPLIRKLRSMEDVWINAKVVEPSIAMLKPSTSQICSFPQEITTKVMGILHDSLYLRNYHYAFVPEEYIVSGRESLDHYKVLILPYASHFPPGLTEKILPWVKSGGRLIISGVAGAFTQYGFNDGKLMNEIFGEVSCQPWYDNADLYWMIKIGKLYPHVALPGSRYGQMFLADYGKGEVFMAVRMDGFRPGGVAAEQFYRMLDRFAPRKAWSKDTELEMVLREDKNALFITIINPNLQNEAHTTICLSETYNLAIDCGIERGFPVPLRNEGTGSAFDISLAPGEGTVIRLSKN